MCGLVVVMIGTRQVYRRRAIEADDAIGLRVVDVGIIILVAELLMVCVMPHGPGHLAAENIGFERRVDQPQP